MRNLNRGENLTKEELQEIYRNLRFTKHSIERLAQRGSTKVEVYNTIKKPFIAYFNTDGSINIAPNNWQCYIIERDRYNDGYVLITYKEEVWLSMKDKQKLAQKGVDRIK